MASLSGHNTVMLRCEGGRHEEFIVATAAATPGMNVVPTNAVRVQEVDTAAPGASSVGGTDAIVAGSQLWIVKERGLVGETIDDAVAVGDRAGAYSPRKGDVMLVLALSGEDIDKEEGIAFNAAGKAVAAATGIVARSVEDTGGALAADTHIRVRFV